MVIGIAPSVAEQENSWSAIATSPRTKQGMPLCDRYAHADACHICGRYSLHSSNPGKAARKWQEPCKAAARFHTDSNTHELELAERVWRCKWCHKKGKDLIADCTGHRPPPKQAFRFKKPTKKTLRRQKGRRLWGRPQAKARRDRLQRHRRRGADIEGRPPYCLAFIC